ncbi:unnamed protein product [Dovyalis caffra]|uniref:Uncharacterized protein n=1 Tax=Dovyalis caffra TaxID=77055 RepID=A0AAV1QTJ5_9ROSI|nr:unnamed protein product [Dovyalis caffra]
MSVTLNIHQGPSRSPSRSPSGSTVDRWLDSLKESRELHKISHQMEEPIIPGVPSELREVEKNKDCYMPRVVSIGPCHHGKEELEKMEKLKIQIAGQFVEDERVIAEEMYRKVKELVGYARECYAEELTHQFNDEKFAQMMFLDGCFILDFFDNELEKKKIRNEEEVALVKRDLFLLENQLPFQVLLPLMRGELHIPPLSIDDTTKPLLLNLAAFEACGGGYSGLLTSYVCFMRSLIEKPQDVNVLRSKGILCTTIGSDDEIAQLFKDMTTNLVPNPSVFIELKKAIESHYRNTFKRWIAHYKAPISTTVVKYSFIYGFVVSAIQAYLAEVHKKPGFGNCSCPNATQIRH